MRGVWCEGVEGGGCELFSVLVAGISVGYGL